MFLVPGTNAASRGGLAQSLAWAVFERAADRDIVLTYQLSSVQLATDNYQRL